MCRIGSVRLPMPMPVPMPVSPGSFASITRLVTCFSRAPPPPPPPTAPPLPHSHSTSTATPAVQAEPARERARERAESVEADAEVTGGDEAGGESQRTALTRNAQRTARQRCGMCTCIKGGKELGFPGSHPVYRCIRRRRLAKRADSGRVQRGSDLGLGFQ